MSMVRQLLRWSRVGVDIIISILLCADIEDLGLQCFSGMLIIVSAGA